MKLLELRHEWRSLRQSYPDFVYRDVALPTGDIPIFVFHTIEPDRFERQLRYLNDNGYRTLSSVELLDLIEGRKQPLGNEVAITIDDARSSFWRYGLPLLRRYQCQAILFVIPGWTSEQPPQLRANLDTASLRELQLADPRDQTICSWNELRAARDSGLISIESHTYFHRRVFSQLTVTGCVGPGANFTASDAVYAPYLDLGMRPGELPAEQFFGLPLMPTCALMQAPSHYEIPQPVRDECQALYRKLKSCRTEGEIPAEYVSGAQRIIDAAKLIPLEEQAVHAKLSADLSAARTLIAERLGDTHAGRQLCLPFTLGSEAVVEIADNCGVTAIYWGIDRKRRINRPGCDPLRLVRLKNDFIWRLPGQGRRPLAVVYATKVARRLRGIAPY